MWRTAMVCAFVGAASLLMLPAAAQAQFHVGDWELTLTGSGASDNDLDANTIAANVGLGYFVTDQIELALRQGVGFADNEAESSWNASTRVAADFHFDFDRIQPFVGGSFGGIYGDDTEDTFLAGPEGGVKFFVNDTTFIFAMVEYQFFFEDEDDADEAFDDGQFVYSLGIGFRF
jgi:hypothetical protein